MLGSPCQGPRTGLHTSDLNNMPGTLVAPPGLLTHHARGKPQPASSVDLHDSMITDLHFSMDIRNG
jgi:hypothetical protein